jgi:hypothetical protein
MSESAYTCDLCGKTIAATETKTLYKGNRMIGMAETYTHECVEGRTLHPFALIPFPDSRDELWSHLEDRLDLRPADEDEEPS